MKINHLYLIYFSPAGGTKKCVELMDGLFGLEAQYVDILSSAKELDIAGDALAVFAVPVYGGRIPGPVYERMEHITGHGTPCLIMPVYGNRAVDDAGLEMGNLAKERHFIPVACASFIAPHSVSPAIASSRPDEKDTASAVKFRAELEKKLRSADKPCAVTIPGNEPYREFDGIPLKPSASRKCTSCMKCADECPAKAIPADNPRKTDTGRCISCMHCVRICPVSARRIPIVPKIMCGAALKKICKTRREAEYIL